MTDAIRPNAPAQAADPSRFAGPTAAPATAGTLNRAATALGTDHSAWNATRELLSGMDERMQPDVAGFKPNPY